MRLLYNARVDKARANFAVASLFMERPTNKLDAYDEAKFCLLSVAEAVRENRYILEEERGSHIRRLTDRDARAEQCGTTHTHTAME